MDFKKYVFGWCFLDFLCWGYGEIIEVAINLDQRCQTLSTEDFVAIHTITTDLLRQHHIKGSISCSLGCSMRTLDTGCSGKDTYNVVMDVNGTVDRDLILYAKDIRDHRSDLHAFICARRRATDPGSCPSTEPSVGGGSSEQATKKDLAIGLGVGLTSTAGLAAGAGLLYRKLRKKSAVGDESDTTGIIGTPVTPIGEAPNSAPPAGT